MLRRLETMQATGADVRFIVIEAHNYEYVRAGIFDKMENGTYQKEDTDNIKIIQEDFDKGFNILQKTEKTLLANRLGTTYNS